MCLKLALGSRSFFEDTSITERQIAEYKRDLKFFTNLRKIVKQDAQETRMRIRPMTAAVCRTTHETSWSTYRTIMSSRHCREQVRCGLPQQTSRKLPLHCPTRPGQTCPATTLFV